MPVVDTVHQERNMFATGVNIKANGESKVNDSPDNYLVSDTSHTTDQNVTLFVLHFNVVVLLSSNNI